MSWWVGLWPLIWHSTAGIAFVAVMVALAVFAQALVTEVPLLGPFVKVIRRWAVYLAVLGVVGLVGYSMGVHNEADRCKAQFTAARAAAVKAGTSAHRRAAHDSARGVRDPRDTDAE